MYEEPTAVLQGMGYTPVLYTHPDDEPDGNLPSGLEHRTDPRIPEGESLVVGESDDVSAEDELDDIAAAEGWE